MAGGHRRRRRVAPLAGSGAVPACRRARVHPTQQPGVWLTVQNVCMADPETDQDSLSDLQRAALPAEPMGSNRQIRHRTARFPADEYDCLIGPILTRLGRRDSRARCSEYLRNEIGCTSEWMPFAAELTLSWTEYWPGTPRGMPAPDVHHRRSCRGSMSLLRQARPCRRFGDDRRRGLIAGGHEVEAPRR